MQGLASRQRVSADTAHHVKRQTLSGSAASITFTDLPATFSHFEFMGVLLSDRASLDSDSLIIRVGTAGTPDSGSNYKWTYHHAGSGTGFTGSSNSATTMLAFVPTSNHASNWGFIRGTVYDYARTGSARSMLVGYSYVCNTDRFVGNSAGLWTNTADKIDTLYFEPDVGSNFLSGSWLEVRFLL
jgi:hypothetical protein